MAKEFSLNPRKWVNQYMHKTPWDVASAADPYSDTTLVSSNLYQAAFEFSIPVYKKGFSFRFTVPSTNTGAASIRLPGLAGNISLVKGAGTPLAASDLEVGKIYQGVYDGVEIQVEGIAAAAGSTITFLELGATPIKNMTVTFVGGSYSLTPDNPALVTAGTQVICHLYSPSGVAIGAQVAVDILPNNRIDFFAVATDGTIPVATDGSDYKISIYNIA